MAATGRHWRTIDIVVASVLGVAFGVVFWAWNLLWGATTGAFQAFPPAQAVLYGVWLVPAVLAGLVIRRPGAAAYTELVAAMVAALLGSQWGWQSVLEGLVEGLGAELGFALLAYRSFRLPVSMLSGALAGLAAGVFDAFVSWPGKPWLVFRLPSIGITAASALVVAGVGGWLLVRALADTGVLDRFPAGRDRATP